MKPELAENAQGSADFPQVPSARNLVPRESRSMAVTIRDEVGLEVASAQGCFVWDDRGRRYLDLTAGSGVLALGHGHPAVQQAMRHQLDQFVHGGWQLAGPSRGALAERISHLLPWDDPAILWCTTGSEAVEAAMKVARAATQRRQVIGFLGGYHGKTAGSLSVTANASFRTGVSEVPVAGLSLPYPAANGYVAADAPMTAGHDHGQGMLEHPDFGLHSIAGLVVEGVQGAGGMQAAAPGFLTQLSDFTKRHGMLLIVDEIFTGFGRTGEMFGFQHEGVQPDLIILGKALGGGLPVSAVVGPRELLDSVPPLGQTSTFSANPVACAAGAAVLDLVQSQRLHEASVSLGSAAVDRVAKINIPGVRLGARGRGLMIGFRVEEAPTANRGDFTRAVIRRMRNRGVLALRGGSDGTVIKWTPPLTISSAELAAAADVMAEAIEAEASSAGVSE